MAATRVNGIGAPEIGLIVGEERLGGWRRLGGSRDRVSIALGILVV